MEFNFTHFKNISASFFFKVVNATGTGADAIWFYAFCKSTPTTESGTGCGGAGFLIFASEWHDRVGVLWSDKKSNGTFRGAVITDADQTITYANIDNGNWHRMEINLVNQRIWYRLSSFNISTKVYTNVGENTLTYDSATWGTLDKSGTLMGFGARTGGADAAHFIRGAITVRSKGIGYNFPASLYLDEPTV